VLLTWSPRDQKLTNQWASDHCHTMAGGTPILALDMYEHSYHIDYGAKAANYVDVFMAAINWSAVQRDYDRLWKLSQFGQDYRDKRSNQGGCDAD
jgi:Fe-Mn family superoxide dismutase